MKKILAPCLLLSLLTLEATASPVMYLEHGLSNWIVLSDETGTECVKGTYRVASRDKYGEEKNGCWIPYPEHVVIYWLPDNQIETFRRSDFTRMSEIKYK